MEERLLSVMRDWCAKQHSSLRCRITVIIRAHLIVAFTNPSHELRELVFLYRDAITSNIAGEPSTVGQEEKVALTISMIL